MGSAITALHIGTVSYRLGCTTWTETNRVSKHTYASIYNDHE